MEEDLLTHFNIQNDYDFRYSHALRIIENGFRLVNWISNLPQEMRNDFTARLQVLRTRLITITEGNMIRMVDGVIIAPIYGIGSEVRAIYLEIKEFKAQQRNNL